MVEYEAEIYYIFWRGQLYATSRWVKNVWVFFGGTGATDRQSFGTLEDLEDWLDGEKDD